MVNHQHASYQYAVANEEELDALFLGQKISSMSWTQWSKPSRPRPGSVGVVWRSEDSDQLLQPLVLIVNDEDIRPLCGRYAHLQSDFSPLTSWCHLLTPRFFDPLESLVRIPEAGGLEAAWTGVTVAESVLLAERPLAGIKISACLATHGFAIARANALWGHLTLDDITVRFDHAKRLLKNETLNVPSDKRTAKIRTSLQPIWQTLSAMSQGRRSHGEIGPVVSALLGLSRARSSRDPHEANHLIEPLLYYVPEAEAIRRLHDLAPEVRLRIFDKIVEGLDKGEVTREDIRHNALSLLAGYLATVAAGGSPSLTLAENHASRWPEITAWAYVMGSLGERVLWTSSFDGLGRLVARELLRPFHLDEPPTCDFAFDEAVVLADAKLNDPLVHLRVKQARVLTVELVPGVNVSVTVGETGMQNLPKAEMTRPARAADLSRRDPLATIIDALWPHIVPRLDDYFAASQRADYSEADDENAQRNRSRRKSGHQPPLPIGNPKRS